MQSSFAKPITSMLFDLDGTLVDTAEDFARVLDLMTSIAALPSVPRTAIHQTVSNGARALVELAFGIDSTASDFKALHGTLLSLYAQQVTQTTATLYPGMEQLLALLEERGIKWGVVTNKPEQYSIPLLRNLGLLERCQTLICPDHVTFTKPHPEPLLLACTQLGCSPGQSVYVGDHPRDITAGKEAGMYTIAAAYGYVPSEPEIATWGADTIVENVESIRHWLDSRSVHH